MKASHGTEAALRMPAMRCQLGFLASLEAASAILLLIAAASALQLYQFQKASPQGFFLCSDAAIVISKSGDFSSGSLLRQAQKIREISGLCLSVQTAGGEPISACSKENGEVFAFAFPVWDGGLQELGIRCWQG